VVGVETAAVQLLAASCLESERVVLYPTSELIATESPAVERVDVCALRQGWRLRTQEIDADHLNVICLAKGKWPPIVVRRGDNAIIDGNYRYLAACRLGYTHIECMYFDGGDEDAFLEALRRNLTHGLPLSLEDRKRAARLLLQSHPEWSDRRIAGECSLAPGTLRRLRAGMPTPGEANAVTSRLGRDGRRRPVDPEASRQRILRVIAAHPEHSLGEIARITQTSPATVRSVVKRPPQESHGSGPQMLDTRGLIGTACGAWVADSALSSMVDGKDFAHWLEQTTIRAEWEGFVDGVPLSRVYEVADEARRRGRAWVEFAERLEARINNRRPQPAHIEAPPEPWSRSSFG
jgi:ParB-like chromosome segregation protein Spo0J